MGSRRTLLRHRQLGANERERQREHKCRNDFRFHVYPIRLADLIPATGILRFWRAMQVKQSGMAMSKPKA
jgi:hypothetical protein